LFKWKKALSLLLAVCVLLAGMTVGTLATDRPSAYEVCMTNTITVDGIDDTYYTVYARVLAFAVDNPATYLVTDYSVTWPMEVIDKNADAFLAALEKQGVTASKENLADLITANGQMYHVWNGESWISAGLAFAVENTNAAVLQIASATDAIAGAVPAVFATGASSGDAVSNLKLNATDSELYGFVEGDIDLNAFTVVPQSGTLTHVTSATAQDLPASIVDTDPSTEEKISAIMADITRSYGAVGSPLLNAKNEVIGITTYDAEKDVTYVISSDDVARELDARGIIESKLPSKDAASNVSSGLGGIGVGASDDMEDSDLAKIASLIKYAIFVAIALVLVLIVLLIIRLRRDRNVEDDTDEAAMEEEYAQRQRELRKRHQERHAQMAAKQEEPAAPPPNIRPAVRPVRPVQTETQPAASEQPVSAVSAAAVTAPADEPAAFVTMTVVNGKKKGYSQRVDGRTVIGRDPATCKMLFPASDTTISRTHCALTFIPSTGVVVLEDLNSANGTYSASGRRLIPGKKYRVRLGDKFYLGTEENMIEVK